MDLFDAIQARCSTPKLDGPAPTAEQLQTLLSAAIRAPDHGVLRPWRFIPVVGDERQRLGELMLAGLLEDDPALPQVQQDKARNAPLRAPMVLIVVAEVQLNHRIPKLDQVLAVAAATQNLLLAAQALGLGAMWRSGAPALSPAVKKRLGFAAHDEIVGFVYLGQPSGASRAPGNETPQDFIRKLP